MNHLTHEPISLDQLMAETADPSCGGVVIFSGDVRDHNKGRQVTGITFEAHEAIAEKALAKIEAEVCERFDAEQCRLQHRLGYLAVGDPSVIIVVRSAHRADAFAACRWAIDELKERVPIWKQEHYADGTSAYLDGVPLRTE